MSYLATSKVRNELYRIACEGFRHHNTEGSTTIKDVPFSEPFIIASKDIYIDPPAATGYQVGYEVRTGSLLIKFHKDNVPEETRHRYDHFNLKDGCFFKIIVGHKSNYHVVGPKTYNTYVSDYFFIPQEQLNKIEVGVMLLRDIVCDGEPLYKGPETEVEASYVDGVGVLLCSVIQKQDMRPDNVRYLYVRNKSKIKISVQVAQGDKWKTVASEIVDGERSFSVGNVMEIMDNKQLEVLEGGYKRVFTDDQIYHLYMYAPNKLFGLGVTSPKTLDYYLQHGVPIETLDQIRFLMATEELNTNTFLEVLTSGTLKTMESVKVQNKIKQGEEKLSTRTRIKRSSIFG